MFFMVSFEILWLIVLKIYFSCYKVFYEGPYIKAMGNFKAPEFLSTVWTIDCHFRYFSKKLLLLLLLLLLHVLLLFEFFYY